MREFSSQKNGRTANIVRGLAIDAVQKANSGHPGLPMGMADAAVVLWSQFLKHNPADHNWPDRDRFVLSAGHGSMLLYSLLHLSGYDLPLAEIINFRQWGSLTPGHPENFLTDGVETTTGPLGQGFTNAVGMAMAERWLAERFNQPDFPVVDHYTYALGSDGDMMEGISHEAASLAGHLALGKLIVLYDDNGISIDGPTEMSFTEDVVARFDAYGWHTQRVDGHDPTAVADAISAAREESHRPSLIACRTIIGFGSPNRQGTSKAHGEPLGADEIRLTKERLGLPPDEDFYVDEVAPAYLQAAGQRGAAEQQQWAEMIETYRQQFPDLAGQFQSELEGNLDVELDMESLFDPDKAMATRNASGIVLNALAPQIPNLIGGSADLTPSNKTDIKGEADLTTTDFSGRYIRFGVREHAMGGILNGLALHGGLRPYGGTFLVFSDYMRGAVRLAALMDLPIILVYTHDSIGVGEDGPTHQPVEHAMALRVIPGLTVFRPADTTETAAGWMAALATQGPTALLLTRQSLPNLSCSVEGALRGGYILSDTVDAEDMAVDPQVILIATGSELQLAVEAQDILSADNIRSRVVSMPSWELFDEQSDEYRDSVLPPAVTARVSVEAGVTTGWEHYVGLEGQSIGIDRFGASAPYQRVYEELGVTAEAVAAAARSLLD